MQDNGSSWINFNHGAMKLDPTKNAYQKFLPILYIIKEYVNLGYYTAG